MSLKRYAIVGIGVLFIFQSTEVTAQNTGYDTLLETLLYTTLEVSADAALNKIEPLKSNDNHKEQYTPGLFNNTARSLIDLGEREEAKRILRYGMSEFPGEVKLLEAYALAELKLANYESAEQYFSKAIEKAKKDTSISSSFIKTLNDQYKLVHYREKYSSITGAYRSAAQEGRLMLVKYDPYQGTYPGFIDLSTGQYEILYPETDSSFYYRNSSGKQNGTVKFSTKREKKKLTWETEEGSTETFISKKLLFRDIEFESGNARLSGTLILPEKKGPFPAVILVHGGGYLTRYNLYFEALNFASQGIAAFVYDKHGAGTSTGTIPVETPYNVLSKDASTALETVRAQPEIHAGQVGLWGHSEGGWIVPLTSNRNTSVAFNILAAGAAVDVFQQVIQSIEANLKDNDFDKSEVGKALGYMRQLEQEIKGGANYHDIQPLIKNAQQYNWGKFVIKPGSDWELDLWRMLMAHNAKRTLINVDKPVLAKYGSRDNTVPPSKNIDLMISYLKKAPTKSYTVEVIEEANHQFLVGKEEYSIEYFSLPAEWIKTKMLK